MALNPEIATAFSLEGKVAVVTGAASGIGQGAACILALAGARIIAVDIQTDGLAATCERIRAAGGEATARQVDVADKDAMEALADATLAETGRLDIWINCAGISPIHSILETDPATARRTIEINMLGTYWGCMAAGRVMGQHGGGAIINISSGGGSKPLPQLPIYGMTKASVNSLTWSAAAAFGPVGVRVNAVAPGWIVTPAMDVMFRNEAGEVDPELRTSVQAGMANSSPLGRVGHPSDIAYALVYLASDAGSFVTGQVLRVNGGESM